jgi:filamentous hemagglutinin family protein
MRKATYCQFFLTLISINFITETVYAQTYQPTNRIPVVDNTLGTQVSGNGNNFDITGGLTKGQTLFHSFTDFSVPTNGQANFLNPAGNRDMITRVTGGLFSDINGTLNSNGANFFLINPNGIVFGANAQLNVGKAFVTSTANGINLVDGSGRGIVFGTNPDGDTPLLTINPDVLFNVSSLTMGGGNGTISNFGTLRTTNPSQYIALIGGNVSLNGGEVIAPGGKVDLGGLAAPGTITLSENNLIFPTSVTRSNVTLTDGSSISVAGSGGGSVDVNAQNLNVLNGSEIAAGISKNAPNSQPGDININVAGNIEVGGNSPSYIYNEVVKDATGNAGNINIKTYGLRVTAGSQIYSLISGIGRAGDLTINATNISISRESSNYNLITSPSPSGLFSASGASATGNAGNINIKTDTLQVTDGSQIASVIRGFGNAGDITIKANNVLVSGESLNASKSSLPNPSGLFSQSEPSATGNAGNLTLTTRRLRVSDGGKVQTATFGNGKAGNLFIKADEIDVVNTPGVNSFYLTNINTGVSFDNNRSVDNIGQPILAEGNGGELTIETRRLVVNDGGSKTNRASISSDTRGIGNAGKLVIRAQELIEIGGYGNIAAKVDPKAVGDAGQIELETPRLIIRDQGKLIANSSGLGKAGNLTVKAKVIELQNQGAIIAETLSGQGGNIDLNATDYLLMRQNSQISTTAGTDKKGGDSGNINIRSPLIIALPGNNDITANAYTGKGGEVTIKSDGLFGIRYRPKGQDSKFTNDITASSDFNQQGTVDIKTPGVDPGKDSTQLPTTATDASNQISQSCSASNRQNKLTVAGRGGIPPTAYDPLTSDAVWQDARTANRQPTFSSTQTNPAKPSPPAVGWVFDGNGKVTLIAAGSEGQPTGTRVVCPISSNK